MIMRCTVIYDINIRVHINFRQHASVVTTEVVLPLKLMSYHNPYNTVINQVV